MFLALALITVRPLLADPDRLTSAEWSGMPKNQKMEYVMMAMDVLKGKDIPLSKTATEYLREIDGVYTKEPDRAAMAVSVILRSLVYANEPASKKIMDDLIKKNSLEKIERL